MMHRNWMPRLGARLPVAAAAIAVPFAFAACGESGSSSGGGAGPGAGSKEIVAFLPPTSDPYAATWLKHGTAAAEKQGYKIRAIQTADSSAAASQVQQALGGKKPAAFVWWPVEPEAQVGSLAALSRSKVPVFQANQLPVKGSEKYLTAYSGVSDLKVGEVSGQAAIEARDALKERGVKLHSEGGNVLVVALPVGYGATRDRLAGFKKAIEGSGLNIIDVGNAKGFSAQDAFTVTQQLIGANRAKGIDIVYGQMDDFSIGAIRALEQRGYKPGEDVEVIGGSCHGDDSQLKTGKQFNTAIQGAGLEGQFAIGTVIQYLKNPKVKPGEYVAPADPDSEPPMPAEISKLNLIPTPSVTAEKYSQAKLWGQPSAQWCTY